MEKNEKQLIPKTHKEWEAFLISITGLINVDEKDLDEYKFDIYFCDTNFYGEEGGTFHAHEMQIKLWYKENDDWHEDFTTFYPELVCGDDQDNDFEACIFINTPDFNPELGNGWSNTGEMTLKEAVGFLIKMPILDYNLLADDEKRDFEYFSSSKMKSKF